MNIPCMLGSTDARFNHLPVFQNSITGPASVNSRFIVTRDMMGVNSDFVFAIDDTFDPIMNYLSDIRDARVRLDSVPRVSPPGNLYGSAQHSQKRQRLDIILYLL